MRGCKRFVAKMAQLAPSCTLLHPFTRWHTFWFSWMANAMITQAHKAFGASIGRGCKGASAGNPTASARLGAATIVD